MRIGIVSDTHGLLRPEVLDAFAHVDHILHAGDIGSMRVLEQLQTIAPVTAVRGNVDVDLPRVDQPAAETAAGGGSDTCSPLGHDILRVTIEGLKILLTHVLPRPGAPSEEVMESLAKDGADVVVFGHSHLPHDEKVGGVWFLNPASAGPRRFDYPVSVAILEKARGDWTVCHVPLDDRSVTALGDRMNQLR